MVRLIMIILNKKHHCKSLDHKKPWQKVRYD